MRELVRRARKLGTTTMRTLIPATPAQVRLMIGTDARRSAASGRPPASIVGTPEHRGGRAGLRRPGGLRRHTRLKASPPLRWCHDRARDQLGRQHRFRRAQRVHRPASVDELAGGRRRRRAGPRARAAGTRSTGWPTPPATWSRWPACRGSSRSAPTGGPSRVDGGIRYGELAPHLHAARAGAAQPRRRCRTSRSPAPSPPPPTAPASATATWPPRWPASSWSRADGEPVRARAAATGDFAGAVVGLGALGVVTALTLDVVPGVRRSGSTCTTTCRPRAARRAPRRDPRRRLQRQPVHRLDGHRRQPGLAQAAPTSRAAPVRLASAPGRRTARGTRSRACRRTTAPSRAACPGRGTRGCRTSGWSSRPSSGAELQSEYLVPRGTRVGGARRGGRRCASGSRRCCRSPRSARSRPTTCG